MGDATGLAEAMLGLDGFRVLEVDEDTDELVITVETTITVERCRRCGTRAKAHDRRATDVRDLACFGRPAWPSAQGVADVVQRVDLGGAIDIHRVPVLDVAIAVGVIVLAVVLGALVGAGSATG